MWYLFINVKEHCTSFSDNVHALITQILFSHILLLYWASCAILPKPFPSLYKVLQQTWCAVPDLFLLCILVVQMQPEKCERVIVLSLSPNKIDASYTKSTIVPIGQLHSQTRTIFFPKMATLTVSFALQVLQGQKEAPDSLDLLVLQVFQALEEPWGLWGHLQICRTLSRAEGALWSVFFLHSINVTYRVSRS